MSNIVNMKQEEVYGFAKNYSVSLYFDYMIKLDEDQIKTLLQETVGGLVNKCQDHNSLKFEIELDGLFDDIALKHMSFDLNTIDVGPSQDLFNSHLNQSWQWKEASGIKDRIVSQVVLSDDSLPELNYKKRLALYQLVLHALVLALKPIGLQWNSSGQLIDPEVYKNNIPGSDSYDILFGPLNVRLYSIDNEDLSTIMDTIGLAALGVVDIQCYFSGYKIEQVADLLYDYGAYVFWNGDVLKDGDTIESFEQYKKWGVRHEISQLEPRRPVINIGPDIKV